METLKHSISSRREHVARHISQGHRQGRFAAFLTLTLLLIVPVLSSGCSSANSDGSSQDELPVQEGSSQEAPSGQVGSGQEAPSGQVGSGQEAPSGQVVESITPKQASDLIEENEGNADFIILDDRVAEDFLVVHIPNAVNIPYGPDFDATLQSLERGKVYLVYCETGCGATSQAMRQLGFEEVYEIQGGLIAWTTQGFPVA